MTENRAKKYLEIKEVLPSIKMTFISEHAGRLEKGDVLVGIGKDDITSWPLRRVIQRVGDFRAPTGKHIRLRFRRSCLKPGYSSAPLRLDDQVIVSPRSAATDASEWGAPSPESGKSIQYSIHSLD